MDLESVYGYTIVWKTETRPYAPEYLFQLLNFFLCVHIHLDHCYNILQEFLLVILLNKDCYCDVSYQFQKKGGNHLNSFTKLPGGEGVGTCHFVNCPHWSQSLFFSQVPKNIRKYGSFCPRPGVSSNLTWRTSPFRSSGSCSSGIQGCSLCFLSSRTSGAAWRTLTTMGGTLSSRLSHGLWSSGKRRRHAVYPGLQVRTVLKSP